jgi:hypothetical protein
MKQHTNKRRTKLIAGTILAAGALVVGAGATSSALVQPGTPGKDVTVGLDNDNASNTFIQPPGVTAKQHMDNTDVLFGRANADLLIGNLGSDTLLGGSGPDILIGGPEKFTSPNSDVLIGDLGDDINIWAPGDGSDAFVGNEGYDTMVFAPFVENSTGKPLLTWHNGRKIPHVDIDDQAGLSCTIVKVPAAQKLGFQYLVRFNVNGSPVVTVRQKDVEKVFCPSPLPGRARVAYLTSATPTFHDVWLNRIGGTTGAILAPVG